MHKIFNNFIFISITIILFCKQIVCIPKYEESNSIYSDNQWRRSYNNKINDSYASPSTQNDRTERLGFTTGYGTGVTGYPHSGSGLGVYSPLKIDLGGIVIGAIIGIGALLIVPKIIGALHGGTYGGNYRSDDTIDPTGLTEMLTRLDDILGKNNIDSTSCVQRAVCNYVRSSEYNLKAGSADQTDQIVHTVFGNSLVDYMLDGTAVKEAIENGKNLGGRQCDSIYTACPIDKESAMEILTKMLPKKGQ